MNSAAQSRIRKELVAYVKGSLCWLVCSRETIAVAVAEPGGEVRSHVVIPNRLEAIRKLIGKLGPANRILKCNNIVFQRGLTRPRQGQSH